MTERYAHYHKNGTVTAKLELVWTGEVEIAEDFVRRHTDRIRESFDGEISAASDASYERLCARDRAYRYRPYTLRVEYAAERVKRKLTMRVFIVCISGRRTVYMAEEVHRFRIRDGAAIYLGTAK